MANNTKKLVELIKNSLSLSEGDKNRLIHSLDSLSAEDLLKLEKTLISESCRVEQIHNEHDKQAAALNEEYEAIMKDFKFKKIPKMQEAKEKEEHAKDEDQADRMIKFLT